MSTVRSSGCRARLESTRIAALGTVTGVVLGLAASYIPARRSTRLEVLEAIQAT